MPSEPPEQLDLGHGRVELSARRFVPNDGGPVVPLTQREVDLLAYLARHPGRMIGRDELAREVWSESAEVASRTVDTAIHRLRTKLEPPASEPRVLLGGAGEGLRLLLPARRDAAPERSPWRTPRSPLIGREDDLADLVELAESAELVTLVGERGAGKTRLAAELAARSRRPVRWVRLEGTTTTDALRHAVGSALRVDWLAGEDPDERIRAGLVGSMLVLDALDGPIDHAAELLPRWAGAPGALVVGTAQAPLLAPQERVIEVGPLRQGPGVAMFVAAAAAAGRPVVEEELDAVHALVARTEGNALAIEIAAIWSAILDPASLLARIDGMIERSRTPRADPLSTVVGCAWSLLTTEEQEALSACAVFPDTFEALEVAALCDAPARVPPALLALRRKGLLRAAGDGDRRLEIPDAVRQFVLDERARHPEAPETAERFARAVWEDAVTLADEMVHPTDPAASARFDGALSESVARLSAVGDPTLRAEILLSLGPALDAAGWLDLHHTLLAAVLDEPLPVDLHGPLIERRAAALLALGELDEAREALATAEAVVGADGDPVLRAEIALDRATLAGLEGRGESVVTFTHEAADLVRTAGRGGRDGRAGPVWMVIGANLMAAGDREGARAAYSEVVRNARAEGSHRRAAAAFVRLANLALDEGDMATASARAGEAEAELRVIGTRAPAALLRVRGALAELRGDDPLAETEWRELASMAVTADSVWSQHEAQLGLARCAVRRDDLETAWDLLAAATAGAQRRWHDGWIEAMALLAVVHHHLGARVEVERIRSELEAARATEAAAFVAALIEDRPIPPIPPVAYAMKRLRYALMTSPDPGA